MKVKINVVDKLIIGQLLPQTEGFLVQMIARDIGRKVEITDGEREIVELKTNPQGQGVIWKTDRIAETEMEIDFSETEISMLQEQIKKLDDGKKITTTMLDTILKIR